MWARYNERTGEHERTCPILNFTAPKAMALNDSHTSPKTLQRVDTLFLESQWDASGAVSQCFTSGACKMSRIIASPLNNSPIREGHQLGLDHSPGGMILGGRGGVTLSQRHTLSAECGFAIQYQFLLRRFQWYVFRDIVLHGFLWPSQSCKWHGMRL